MASKPIKLSDSAELVLQLCSLSAQDEKIVRNCISRYSKSHPGMTEQLKQLFYMVLEEMRSKLSTSDWQQAQKILSQKAFTVLPPLLRNEVTYRGAEKTGELGLSGLITLNSCKTSIPKPIHNLAVRCANLDVVSGLLNKYLKDKAPILLLEPKQFQTKMEGMAKQKAQELASSISQSLIDTVKAQFGKETPTPQPETKKSK